ncbi:MAG: hypothetical protein GW859_02575 [Sphingomonadales bacterium]|nr:hypothetical protein [Sphingomonadales bacterium]
MRRFTILATLGLAACGSDAPPPEQPVEQAATVDPALVEQEGNNFPAAFEGRWGITPEECAKADSTAEMYVTIKGDTLDFADRKGKVTSMRVDSPGRLTTEIAFSGQGRNWQRTTKFFLENEGTQLGRADTDPVIFNVNYTRCETGR